MGVRPLSRTPPDPVLVVSRALGTNSFLPSSAVAQNHHRRKAPQLTSNHDNESDICQDPNLDPRRPAPHVERDRCATSGPHRRWAR
jgi:hypothetical protein